MWDRVRLANLRGIFQRGGLSKVQEAALLIVEIERVAGEVAQRDQRLLELLQTVTITPTTGSPRPMPNSTPTPTATMVETAITDRDIDRSEGTWMFKDTISPDAAEDILSNLGLIEQSSMDLSAATDPYGWE